MSLQTILWLAGLAAEVVVVALCLRARLFRIVPLFSSYVVWSLFVDVGFYLMNHETSVLPDTYRRIYIAQTIVDAVFQFAVLVELGWTVLRPIRASLPKHSILILAVLLALAGAAIWPVAGWTLPSYLFGQRRALLHVQQTFAILRMVIFIGLAAFSQLLSIGWKNRELQIATGLGAYSMVSLAVSVTHTHQSARPYYDQLDMLVVASYLCSLLYWVYSFAQREEERQEFTPQMRSFLLAVTGAARSTRIALAEDALGRPRKPEAR